jgi:hypothetical protein
MASLSYLQPHIDSIHRKAEALDVATPVVDVLQDLLSCQSFTLLTGYRLNSVQLSIFLPPIPHPYVPLLSSRHYRTTRQKNTPSHSFPHASTRMHRNCFNSSRNVSKLKRQLSTGKACETVASEHSHQWTKVGAVRLVRVRLTVSPRIGEAVLSVDIRKP